MPWIDLTRPIVSGMPVWPGDTPVDIQRVSTIEAGDPANVTRITFSAHTGTHVDAPCHFMPDGAGVESLDLDALIGPAYVVDARSATGPIGARDLAALDIPEGVERVLVRSEGGDLWAEGPYSSTAAGISADGARWLIDHRIRLVGVDTMSVAPAEEPAPTHLLLLGNGVAVVEGLELSALQTGHHELIVLPTLVFGADGAPARAVARPVEVENPG